MSANRTPFDTPEYWRQRARDERAFAASDRATRRTVESIRVHEQNAAEYEARAAALETAKAAQ